MSTFDPGPADGTQAHPRAMQISMGSQEPTSDEELQAARAHVAECEPCWKRVDGVLDVLAKTALSAQSKSS